MGIALAFVASAVASVALAVVYILGGQVQLEGALLGVALGGLSVGTIVWAKRGMPVGDDRQDRPELPSPEQERRAAEAAFSRGAQMLERRRLLLRLLATALGALAVAALFPIRSLGRAPRGQLASTSWRAGSKAVRSDGTAVRVEEIVEGTVTTVFPQGHVGAADAQTLLIGVEPGAIASALATDHGVDLIGYSKVCTHAGCPVGLYRPSTYTLFCPCHQSVFDVADGATPTEGPATRPLPRLPIAVDDEGFVIATGDFPEPTGPGYWDRPA
jgi:ubiquinol-cytochrome c reductase iron-sulfur subunit